MNHGMRITRSTLASIAVSILFVVSSAALAELSSSASARIAPRLVPSVASPSPRAEPPQSAVVALLATNQLVVIDTRTGRIVAKQSVAPVPSDSDRDYGHFIAMSAGRDRLYVLVSGDSPATSRLAVLAWPSLIMITSNLLQRSPVVFRSLAVGPRTGRLYLFGNLGNAAIVTVLDPVDGHPLASFTARPAGSYNWRVYQGSVSADEQRLYISYHGPNSTGIDWIDITPAGLQRCRLASRPKIGCLASHGGFHLLDDEILAATGMSQILGFGLDGTLQHQWDTKLDGNHLMEFAIDLSTGKLYVVGSCGYAGGFSAVALASDRAVVVPGVRNKGGSMRGPCGERIALVNQQLLVVAQQAMPVANASRPGNVLFVDTRTGGVVRKVPTPSEPIDVYVTEM